MPIALAQVIQPASKANKKECSQSGAQAKSAINKKCYTRGVTLFDKQEHRIKNNTCPVDKNDEVARLLPIALIYHNKSGPQFATRTDQKATHPSSSIVISPRANYI